MHVQAPAKVNLFLNVVSRRPDGYHDLETVFYPLPGLVDNIEIVHRDAGIALDTGCDDLTCDASNLCWKAAAAFSEASGVDAAWQIRLSKRIPIAAGLAGGSSDAAAVLRLLNRMYENPLTETDLAREARALGADVPFFLNPRPAVGTGIGDVLESFECETELHFVLVNPGFPVPTAWAYAHVPVGASPHASAHELRRALRDGDVCAAAAAMFNVFEVPVCRKFPVVEIIMQFLQEHGALTARLSGSGPTVFGVFAEPDCARHVACAVRERFGPAFWVWCDAG